MGFGVSRCAQQSQFTNPWCRRAQLGPTHPHTEGPWGCTHTDPAAFPSTGSLLLESLKDHISTTAQDHCKAIYLHVLTTNNTAINFYENRDFKQHHYLPYYYSIRGVLKDGFTYVLYINGGHPPWTILYPFPAEQRPKPVFS